MRSLALPVLGLVIACAAPAERAAGIDVDRVLAHVGVLASQPRPGDSAASRAAADYIVASLGAAVIVERVPVGTVDLPAIEVLGKRFRAARRATSTDPDLLVRFGPRAGKALLVMAHYDTVAGSPGALDNAAADGILIELARELAATPPDLPVVLAFTANEERGLVGAEALAARHGDEVSFAIALDLIGGTGPLVVNGASTQIGASELGWLADAAERAGVVVRSPLAHRVISRAWPQAERSDHGPFTRRGIRAVHLYHRGHDGEWIDLAYHSARDVPARVSRAAVDDVGRLVRALATSPVPAHRGDGFWLPVIRNTVIPRWLVVVGCGLGALGTLALVLAMRGPRVDHGRLGVVAGIGCFAVAILVTVAVEQSAVRWIHAPLRATIAGSLVLVGTLGLAITLAGRLAPWRGQRRYLVVAIALPLAIGSLLLVLGAAELAWIWIVPALLAAVGPYLGRARIVVPLVLALPLVLVLAPDQLREAAWNGFLPAGVPLAGWLAVLGAPVISSLAWVARCRNHSGPLGTVVIPMGCLLAALLGLGLSWTAKAPCTSVQFLDSGLACEVRSGMH